MNHLAHALLAADDDARMFGSLIADFVRGRIDPALPDGVRAGIALHRAVDGFTDAHPEIVAARRRFDAPFRRYAGILIDIWFDHLLARDWDAARDGPLDAFSDRVRATLAKRRGEVPPRMRGFAAYLAANGLPAGYRDETMIERVFAGVSTRLSRANPIAGAMPELRRLEAPLLRHFDAFLPELRDFADRERARLDG